MVLLCVATSASLAAQSTKVELSGTVRDPAGLPVPEAEVRLINDGIHVETSASTGNDGMYHFIALQPGTYTIAAAKTGFTTLRRNGVALHVGDQIMLDLALVLGSVAESVHVPAAG